jgi:hypothetical protein
MRTKPTAILLRSLTLRNNAGAMRTCFHRIAAADSVSAFLELQLQHAEAGFVQIEGPPRISSMRNIWSGCHPCACKPRKPLHLTCINEAGMPKPRPAANNPVRICFTLDIRTESAGFCTLQTQEMFNSLQPLNNRLLIHFLGSAEKGRRVAQCPKSCAKPRWAATWEPRDDLHHPGSRQPPRIAQSRGITASGCETFQAESR